MTNPSDEEMDLLIAYALDTLEPQEAEHVRRLLEEHPELRAAAAELRETLEKLPYALPEPDVPPELRARVLAHATSRAAPPARTPRGSLWRRLSLALGGVSGALAIAAALLWGQLGDVQRQLGDTQRQLVQTRGELEQVLAERDQLIAVVAGAEVLAELGGTGGRATVLRTPSGDTLVAAQLPPLAAGRVYQLWAIEGQADPVSAGVFEVGADGTALVTLPAAQASPDTVFAVTNEPGPRGSPGPTGDPLVAGEAVRT
jgi:anti-sigma-K factor RskA